MGIETIVHVGPEPNLVPATFKRLADNVATQMASRSWEGMGLRAVGQAVRRPWLAKILPVRSSLLRAPFVQQVNAGRLAVGAGIALTRADGDYSGSSSAANGNW